MSDQEQPTAAGLAPANLIVAAVRVQDFRVLRDVCVELDRDTTVLIGENNAGKTAFLAALGRAIGGSRSTEDDLHVTSDGTRASSFIVDVRLEPSTGTDFDDDLAGLFGNAVQPPDRTGVSHVTMRTIGEPSADGSGVRSRRRFMQGWSGSRTDAESLATVPNETVDRTRLALVAFTLLDANRDLLGELRDRRSHWGRLLADLDIADGDRSTLEAGLLSMGQQIVDGSGVLSQVRTALDRLTTTLASGAEKVDIAPVPPSLTELSRGMDILVTAPDSAALPLRQQGSGSRSFTSLLVFRAFVELRQRGDLELRPLPVSAFEEPEAHLHPHAAEGAFSQLQDLPGQKIVTTHSPHVGALAHLRSIRMFRRAGSSVEVRRLGDAVDEDVLVWLRRFVLRKSPALLFSRLAILVEGETEEAALLVFAHAHWDGAHTGRGLSIVSVDGAQHFANVAASLESLGIPWLVIADGDQGGVDGVTALSNRLGRDVQDVVFVLPGGADFEQYLVTIGHRPEVEVAVAETHGDNALADYRQRQHGNQLRGKQGTRDFQSDGWEDRLAVDYLRRNKGTLGAAVAHQIVRSHDVPDALRAVFERAASILGGTP